MLAVEEAYRLVLTTARPLPPQAVPLAEAAGRTLRQALFADRPLPPYDRVTMDGIALNYSALAAGQTSFVIERLQLAGTAPMPLTDPRAAVEIMTGAALPPGTDTVIRYEDLDFAAADNEPDAPAGRRATVRVPPPRRGHNVHPLGHDQPAGTRLLAPGRRLGPAEIAVAATVGAASLLVARRPRVAVVSTGDELVPVSAQPLPHQIRTSNAPMLCAALATDGAISEAFHFDDDLAALAAGLPPLLAGFDTVLLSGGVSKGRADFLPEALRAAGAEPLFHGVAQRPGQPFWFGQRPGGAAVFALPGNPVSAFVGYYRYVRGWLRASQGLDLAHDNQLFAELTATVDFRPSLTYFLPVALSAAPNGRLLALPAPTAGSGDLAGLLAADGFLELPPNLTHFNAGTAWPLWLFREM